MKVFKFYGAESALKNIKQRRLKMSTLDDLNDPFEFFGLDFEERESRRAWERIRKDIYGNKGVVCFCKGWSNPVIWSHYAEKHTGLALGFEVPDNYLSKINYSNHRFSFRSLSEIPRDESTELIRRAMLTKFKHWEYEREVRMVNALGHKDAETGLYFLNFSDSLVLKEVIIGPRSKVSSLDIRNAFGANETLRVITSRLSFREFKVVRQQDSRRHK